jgi:hypothetical protein
MFDEILKLVKDQIAGNPEVASAIPQDQQSDVHNEIAAHINNGIQGQVSQGGIGGLLSSLMSGMASGGVVTNAIEGGLVSSLGSKFGLPPAATGAIAAALPGLLQKFANKANDPNDQSITADSILSSLKGTQ